MEDLHRIVFEDFGLIVDGLGEFDFIGFAQVGWIVGTRQLVIGKVAQSGDLLVGVVEQPRLTKQLLVVLGLF